MYILCKNIRDQIRVRILKNIRVENYLSKNVEILCEFFPKLKKKHLTEFSKIHLKSAAKYKTYCSQI